MKHILLQIVTVTTVYQANNRNFYVSKIWLMSDLVDAIPRTYKKWQQSLIPVSIYSLIRE